MKIHGEHLNRAGFRTHEFTPKSPDVYRIVSLGDSCTIGVFTDIKRFGYVRAPYPARLEQLISERVVSPRVEVFNVGVGGYNSFHGLMLLRSKLRGLDPDLITVRFGWNDHFISPWREERAFSEPENPDVIDVEPVEGRAQNTIDRETYQILETRRAHQADLLDPVLLELLNPLYGTGFRQNAV